MADSTSSASLNNRRRRAMIACTNCRKRKIKCVTSEEPPRNPCARCTKRSLTCEYVAVDDDYATMPSTPEHPGSQLPYTPYTNAPARYTNPGSGYMPNYATQYSSWSPPAPSPPANPGYLGHPTNYNPSHMYAQPHNPYGGSQGLPPQFGGQPQYNQYAQGSQQPRCTCHGPQCYCGARS
ncbi:hypothetical protein C8R47DRAFT_771318 [Mycena vitilis]|nr:hypothetical protein C8R47DRAFT_771318 [Mycena vitilis]